MILMGFWKNLTDKLSYNATSSAYVGVGEKYATQRYFIVKDKFKNYIDNLDELLKLYNRRNVTEIDKDGKKVKKYKDDIRLLTYATIDYYQYAEREAKSFMGLYFDNKHVKDKFNKVDTLWGYLINIQSRIGFSFKETHYHTTANNIKLPNAIRWKKQRKLLIIEFEDMKDYFYKM